MFGDVIEAEKAAQEDEGARGAVVADILLDPEGAVEDASVDVRDLEGGAGDEAFARDSGGDQAADQAVRGHPVALVKFGVLPAGEDAGVVADEREPGGVGGRETEFAEGLLTAGEMGDLEGLPHGSQVDGPVNLEADGEERSIGLTRRGRREFRARLPPQGRPLAELACWVIPGLRVKSRQVAQNPLSSAALEVLKRMPRPAVKDHREAEESRGPSAPGVQGKMAGSSLGQAKGPGTSNGQSARISQLDPQRGHDGRRRAYAGARHRQATIVERCYVHGA